MMEIEDPVVLAKLPKPLQDNGQHKYGPVYGLTAGQKKKRHEVLVAINGNSVNIYEVEHGTIKASYAIPPASTFICSPSSIRVKTGKYSYSRYTYCATRKQGHWRLDCFEERFENDLSQGVTSSGVTLAHNDGEGEIAHLEIMPEVMAATDSRDQHVLYALHHNGVLRRYSMDLRHEESVVRLTELRSAEHAHVLAARWLTLEEGRNATLKHRPDLLAAVEPRSIFLSVLYRRKSESGIAAHVGIWSIPSASKISRSQIPEVAALVVYNLPEAQLWTQAVDLECSFNPKATSLLVTGVKGVASYDLSSYSPRMTWEQQIQDHGLSSVRVNNSFVITSTTTSLTIHDTKYNSSRATLDLTSIGKKRKRETESTTGRGLVRLVGYFRELGKLVTIRRNHLLSFELSGGQKEALLIDSIGCGASDIPKIKTSKISELEIGIVEDLAGIPSEQWMGLQQSMSEAVEAGDAAAFEATALKAVRDPDSLDHLSDQQIEFILAKIFQCVEDVMTGNESALHGRNHLQIALPAYTVLAVLIEHGAVKRHKLQQALRDMPRAGKARHIEAGMVPRALIESDGSFTLLETWFDSAEFLNATELAAAVGILVNLLYSEVYAHTTKTSRQSPQDNGDDMDMDGSEVKQELLRFPSGSSTGLQPDQASVTNTLIKALEKLAVYEPSIIAEGLKSSLNRTDTLALIQVLRQQLYKGQHTMSIAQSSYPSPALSAHSSNEDRYPEHALTLDSISKLLLGCIDAIGPLGFFADEAQDDFVANLIPDLRSETALATRGLEEAAYLCGVLRETMRYAESADKDRFADPGFSLIEDAARATQKPGTIMTLYSEPSAEQGDIGTMKGLLPLSLHADDAISLTKMRKGGGQVKDRTLREVREIENRNKGLYSFERLVL